MKLYILHSWAFLFFISAAHLYESPITTAADNNFDFFLFFLFATENKSWHFHVLADNSHEMSTLVFSENRENKLRLSSTTNFAWHFQGRK